MVQWIAPLSVPHRREPVGFFVAVVSGCHTWREQSDDVRG